MGLEQIRQEQAERLARNELAKLHPEEYAELVREYRAAQDRVFAED